VPRAAQLSAEPGAVVVDVIVGIVLDARRRVLIARRPAGKHMAGAWEFPGGKLNPGEPPLAGLQRELEEEIGIVVESAEPLLEQRFRYPDRTVRLDVWWVSSFRGRAEPREGQELRWVAAESLAAVDLLPADEPIVAAVVERLA
jgi:8-oxo-dGTP diphosphatase